MEGEGFEPSKAKPSDLQSDPFDRSGTPPSKKHKKARVVDFSTAGSLDSPASTTACLWPQCSSLGAATRSRTLDLLITSELLCLLSYGGKNGSGILKKGQWARNAKARLTE